MNNFIEIEFDIDNAIKSIEKSMYKTKKELAEGMKKAVAKTVLFGIAAISLDCPVDTGRARASIGGKLAAKAGINLRKGIKDEDYDPAIIQDGKEHSFTEIKDFDGVIGSNVDYIIFIEYGLNKMKSKKLTYKQLKYLFKNKILENKNGKIIYNPPKKSDSKVTGKGMFRGNAPKIERYFTDLMNEVAERAIKAGD